MNTEPIPNEWYHDHSYWEFLKVNDVKDNRVYFYWNDFSIPVEMFRLIYQPGGYRTV